MPMGMWLIFNKSFRKNLTEVLPENIQSLRVDRIATAVIRKEMKNKIL